MSPHSRSATPSLRRHPGETRLYSPPPPRRSPRARFYYTHPQPHYPRAPKRRYRSVPPFAHGMAALAINMPESFPSLGAPYCDPFRSVTVHEHTGCALLPFESVISFLLALSLKIFRAKDSGSHSSAFFRAVDLTKESSCILFAEHTAGSLAAGRRAPLSSRCARVARPAPFREAPRANQPTRRPVPTPRKPATISPTSAPPRMDPHHRQHHRVRVEYMGVTGRCANFWRCARRPADRERDVARDRHRLHGHGRFF